MSTIAATNKLAALVVAKMVCCLVLVEGAILRLGCDISYTASRRTTDGRSGLRSCGRSLQWTMQIFCSRAPRIANLESSLNIIEVQAETGVVAQAKLVIYDVR